MITFTQITKSKDLAALTDYYVLDVRTTGPDPSTNAITSVSMLQIEDLEVLKEAVVLSLRRRIWEMLWKKATFVRSRRQTALQES